MRITSYVGPALSIGAVVVGVNLSHIFLGPILIMLVVTAKVFFTLMSRIGFVMLKKTYDFDRDKHDDAVMSLFESYRTEPRYTELVLVACGVFGSVFLAMHGWYIAAILFISSWWLNAKTRDQVRDYIMLNQDTIMIKMIFNELRKRGGANIPPELRKKVDEIKSRRDDE